MEGASVAGGIIDRATAAWNAGCDMLLVCNSPELVDELLSQWSAQPDPLRSSRVERLLPLQSALPWQILQANPAYRAGLAAVAALLPSQ
jgi:beta-N-acetylhexosaminidase